MTEARIGDIVATPILMGVVNEVSNDSVVIEDRYGNSLVAPRTQVAVTTPATEHTCGHVDFAEPCGKSGCVAFDLDANIWW